MIFAIYIKHAVYFSLCALKEKPFRLICCFICRLPGHVIIGESKYKSWLRNHTQEGRLSFNEIFAATFYTSSAYRLVWSLPI